MIRVKRERGESSQWNDVKKEKPESSRRNQDDDDLDDEDDARPPQPTRQRGKSVAGSETDRRRLRSRYRELKNDVNDGRGQLAHADSCKFREIFDKVEGLHQFVDRPREQIADADLFLDITNELLDVAKGARTRGGMSPAEFVGAIIHNFGLPLSGDEDPGPRIDWEAVGMEACLVLREAPGISTMVGPMEVNVKTRKPPISRKRDPPTEKTLPEEVEEVCGDRPSTETDANMSTMFGILIELQQIELDRLIFNRISFAQTIENLFALSFLVKDGRVEIKIPQDGIQLVVPRNAPSHADRMDGEVLNAQFVFRLDFGCWREMKHSVPKDMEVMPHRVVTHGSKTATARTHMKKNSHKRTCGIPVVITEYEDKPEDDS